MSVKGGKMNNEIQKTDFSEKFKNALAGQMSMLMSSTGKTENELKKLLVAFAYETKQMLDNSKEKTIELSPTSIKIAFMNMLDTGIPVDKRGLAYVTRRGNNLLYLLGYKGYIYKLKEILKNAFIKAELVYGNDTFRIVKENGNAKYIHKIANPFAKRNEIVGAYAYMSYTDEAGEHSVIETMDREEIEKIRQASATFLKMTSVWDIWYGEMAKKAVIRRLCKTLTVGNKEIQKLDDVDNQQYNLKPEQTRVDYDTPVDMPEEIQNNQADILEDTTEDTTTEKKTLPPTTNPEEPVDNVDNTDNTDNTDDAMNSIFKIKTFVEKEDISKKTGKKYTLIKLYLDNGTPEGLQVNTFDKKDFIEGQMVELVDWNKEKNCCKKVNIL